MAATLVVGFLLLAAPASGSVFYVSTAGSDSNPGTIESPWRTIQHAADRVGPGDTVYARGGTYRESVHIERAGRPGKPITFASYPGERAVLDGRGLEENGFVIDSDTVINGFTVQNHRDFGIVAAGTNDRITLRDLVVRGNGDAGIRLSNSDGSEVRNVLLKSNRGGFDCTPIEPASGPGCTDLHIADVRSINNGTGNDTAVDAFAVEKGSRVLVEDSLASGGPGDGFDLKSDETTVRRVVSRNTMREGIKLWGKRSRIENAVSTGHGMGGLVLAAGGSHTVVNSLIANTRRYGYTAGIGDYQSSKRVPVTLRNTIFVNTVRQSDEGNGALIYMSEGVRLTADHNLYYNPYREDCVIDASFAGLCFSAGEIPGRLKSVTGQGTGSIYAKPGFVDPARDFCLGPGSPALDAGSAADAPSLDLEGRHRPAGSGFDMGPYEATPTITLRRLKMRIKSVGRKRRSGRRRVRLVVRFTLSAAARVRVVVTKRVRRRGAGNRKRTGKRTILKRTRKRTILERTVNAKQGANRFTLSIRARKGRFTGTASVPCSTAVEKTRFRR